jgi:hypothetical protein
MKTIINKNNGILTKKQTVAMAHLAMDENRKTIAEAMGVKLRTMQNYITEAKERIGNQYMTSEHLMCRLYELGVLVLEPEEYDGEKTADEIEVLQPEWSGVYTIIEDVRSFGDGGFRKGARFQGLDLRYMIKRGSLDDGVKLSYKGDEYIVAYGGLTKTEYHDECHAKT